MLDQKLDQMDEKDRDRSLLLVNSLPKDFGSFHTRISLIDYESPFFCVSTRLEICLHIPLRTKDEEF